MLSDIVREFPSLLGDTRRSVVSKTHISSNNSRYSSNNSSNDSNSISVDMAVIIGSKSIRVVVLLRRR